jgi:hypothetical protein
MHLYHKTAIGMMQCLALFGFKKFLIQSRKKVGIDLSGIRITLKEPLSITQNNMHFSHIKDKLDEIRAKIRKVKENTS